MTTEELFHELDGAVVSVDGTLCYPQLNDFEGEESFIEALDGDLCIYDSEVKKISISNGAIYLYLKDKVEPYILEVFTRVMMKEMTV